MRRVIGPIALSVLLATAGTASVCAAPVYADQVISHAGGTGNGVYVSGLTSYAGPIGAGTFDATAVTSLDNAGWALGGASGIPGTITMRFSTVTVVDGPGADLRLFDSFGLDEGFNLDISDDGVAFFAAGSHAATFATCSPTCTVDIDVAGSGLSSFSYVRLTAGNGSVFGYPEAYDLDAIEALNLRGGTVPEPASLAIVLAGLGLLAGRLRR